MIFNISEFEEKIIYVRYEFNKNHGEWVHSVNPGLGPGLKERIWEAVEKTYEDREIDLCHSVISELRAALSDLVGVGILILLSSFYFLAF